MALLEKNGGGGYSSLVRVQCTGFPLLFNLGISILVIRLMSAAIWGEMVQITVVDRFGNECDHLGQQGFSHSPIQSVTCLAEAGVAAKFQAHAASLSFLPCASSCFRSIPC
jgi:hypothetical protein